MRYSRIHGFGVIEIRKATDRRPPPIRAICNRFVWITHICGVCGGSTPPRPATDSPPRIAPACPAGSAADSRHADTRRHPESRPDMRPVCTPTPDPATVPGDPETGKRGIAGKADFMHESSVHASGMAEFCGYLGTPLFGGTRAPAYSPELLKGAVAPTYADRCIFFCI